MNATLSHINERQIELKGRALLYFGGCDYLGLSRHPDVIRRLQSSAGQTGHVSVGASRSTTGNHAVFESLESEIAAFVNCESAALTGAGYLANLSLATFFREHASHLIIDSMAHSSLKDAARLSGLPTHFYQHRNVSSASGISKELGTPSKCLLLTDGVFGLDGTMAPLRDLHHSLPEGIGFVIDDAHGFGVAGTLGKGTGTEVNWGNRMIIRTLSLAKALGCHGGAVAGDQDVVNNIKSRSPVWSGHTPFPVSLAEACSVSLSVLIKDRERHRRLNENMKWMKRLFKESDRLPKREVVFPVVSFVCDRMKDSGGQSGIEQVFMQNGIYPSIIRYSGAGDQLLIRLAIGSEHPPEDMEILVSTLETLHESYPLKGFFLSSRH